MAPVPFDGEKLQRLLTEAKVDAIVATSRHNVRYLTGGYVDHFHERAPRGGSSQYVAAVGILRGHFDVAFYVGGASERRQLEAMPIWIPQIDLSGGTTVRVAATVAARLQGDVGPDATIAVELPFLPADGYMALQRALPHAMLVDATDLLHELRAIKTASELARMRQVADGVAQSIAMAFETGGAGVTTSDLSKTVEQAMTERGIEFLWSFTCAGPSYLRAPSKMTWDAGQVLHLDCGGEIGDFLADICRMGSRGQPSALANELHAECLDLQTAVRRFVHPGAPYAELAIEGERAMERLPHGKIGRFTSHGIGMVSHEQPMISSDSKRLLEAGMVLSIESEFHHPDVGHVKIEDVVAVTPTGCEGMGDIGRDWQIV